MEAAGRMNKAEEQAIAARGNELAAMAIKQAQELEKKLDAEITAMDNLTTDDFETLRKRRIEQLKAKQAMMQEWKRQGHGWYQEISDQQQFFEETKTNTRVVCHFYCPTTWRCEIVDKHMEMLSKKHMETRVIKINAEKCPFLAERLMIVVMPTIIMTNNNETIDRIEGFDELGGRDDFKYEEFERRVAKKGAIDYEGDLSERPYAKEKKPQFANRSNPKGRSIYGVSRAYNSDSD